MTVKPGCALILTVREEMLRPFLSFVLPFLYAMLWIEKIGLLLLLLLLLTVCCCMSWRWRSLWAKITSFGTTNNWNDWNFIIKLCCLPYPPCLGCIMKTFYVKIWMIIKHCPLLSPCLGCIIKPHNLKVQFLEDLDGKSWLIWRICRENIRSLSILTPMCFLTWKPILPRF